jgi:hypothetical protein
MATPPRELPRGARFSYVYLDRGEPTQDSVRMRRRIGSQIYEFKPLAEHLAAEVRREIGIKVPYPVSWPDFLQGVQLRDVLDLITVAFRVLQARNYGRSADHWLGVTQRIFQEENVHYRLDDQGGVHFHFDEEFSRNLAAAIAVLQGGRYQNALHAFEGAMAALAKVPPDGKAAIRGGFSAAESVFRLVLPNAPRLGAAELDGLTPLIQRIYAQDDTARRSSAKMLSSFKDWVDAAHFYRHEEGVEEVAQPPLGLARIIEHRRAERGPDSRAQRD